MSINYFKKLGETAPNDFALYLENYILEKQGREKVTKEDQYTYGRYVLKENMGKYAGNAEELIFSKEMGGDYVSITRITHLFYCNDFVARDEKGDRWDYSKLLANFMVENLKGEDKANYINDFQKVWQKRLTLNYELAKYDLGTTVNGLNTSVNEDDLSA